MMGPFLVIWFVLLTILFLIIAGGCFIYLMMGIGQLVTGYKERSYVKKRSGWITTTITLVILSITIYYYLRLILS